MKLSQAGIDLIKSFEGLSLKAVRLQGEQYWTIGYGHYGPDVKPNQTMTQAEAEALLRKDLVNYELWTSQVLPWPVNQNQYDALVSFCYNGGQGMLRQLVTGYTKEQVAGRFLLFTGSSSPAFTQGLRNRRAKERALFLTPTTEGEDDEMTGEQIYKALLEYTATLTPPPAMEAELQAAKEAGVWDGTNPSNFATRWQVAAMAYRTIGKQPEAAELEATPEEPILVLVRRIHELESENEALRKENQDLRDEINVLYSDVHTAEMALKEQEERHA